MHQVVAGSGGNTIHVAPRSTGIHEEYIKVLGSPQTQYQSVGHYYLQLMENPTTYATHTEIVAANQLIIVQHPSATDIRSSTLSITTKCEHM